MVEKKKSGYWLTHLGLILGVLFIFFPVWLTFVASTVTQDAIIYPPLPMLPGTEFFENYANALFRGSPEGYGAKVPVIKMMMNSAIMAIGITVKIPTRTKRITDCAALDPRSWLTKPSENTL